MIRCFSWFVLVFLACLILAITNKLDLPGEIVVFPIALFMSVFSDMYYFFEFDKESL